MTPDRRLDQLEPSIADSLQKIDRLIEGQDKLVDLAVNTKTELDEVKATGDATATAVTDLAASTQQQFDRLYTGQSKLQEDVIDLKANIADLKVNQELILQILWEKLS